MRRHASTGAAGAAAEDLVARDLERRGFEIVERNARVGRLELDIVARRGALLVVVEVRSRSTARFGSPAATVDRRKIERVRRATAQWISLHRPGTRELRFDVAAVTTEGAGRAPHIEYFEAAF